MKKLPLSKQLTFAAIVVGVAMLTSFLLALLRSAAAGQSGQPLPSPLIGLTLGVVAGAAYLGLAGNRKVALASDDSRKAALEPVTDGTARLIVFRKGFYGKLAGIDVMVDGATRAQLKSPRFAVLPLTPGIHEIGARVQGKDAQPLTLNLAPDETIVVELSTGLKGPALAPAGPLATMRDTLAAIPMVQS